MISIVIPFFNEEKRLKDCLNASLRNLIKLLPVSFELVLINDGSTDKTLSMLENIKKTFSSFPVQIISYSKNQGKGFAVKTGVLKSKGNKIVVMDADFSIDINEIPKLLKKLDNNDLVVGTKKHLLTQTLKKQKIPRRILGKGFTFLTNLLLGLDFTDITCGFKGFRSNSAKMLFKKQKMNRWSYDAETLYLAKKFNLTTLEIPVKWWHVEGSRVSPLFDSIRSLKDLALIIINYKLGNYD